MKKKLNAGSFVPYRKSKNPPAIDKERLAVTEQLNVLLRDLAIAMDCGGADGKIAFRDGNGTAWVVAIDRMDVAQLKCEYDLQQRMKQCNKK